MTEMTLDQLREHVGWLVHDWHRQHCIRHAPPCGEYVKAAQIELRRREAEAARAEADRLLAEGRDLFSRSEALWGHPEVPIQNSRDMAAAAREAQLAGLKKQREADLLCAGD